MKRSLLLTVAAAVVAAGCGTTVPLAQRGPLSNPTRVSAGTTPQVQSLPGATAGPDLSPGATRSDEPTGSSTGATTGGAGNVPASASPGPAQTIPGGAPTGLTNGGISTRGPLTIGMIYSNDGAANSALGLATSASVDPPSVTGALVSALNRQGGLAGRKIAVDYFPVDATSSDYSTEAQAACANFTQDHPVPVVVDFTFGTRYGMSSCLAKYGVADFGIGTSDTVGDNEAGLFSSPDWMTSTRRYRAVLDGLHASGYLTSKNKVGVLLENCGYLQRAYQQSVLPETVRLGLTVVDVESFDCTTGFSSAGTSSSEVSSAILHFRAHGVDRVMIVSDYEQVALLLLANQAESQGWRPGYMLSSASEVEVVRADIPAGQWPQLHGVGWSPGLDIDDPHQTLPPTDQHCLELIAAGGLTVSGWQNVFTATSVCAEIFLLEAALQKSSGQATGQALIGAVENLGSSFASPGIVGGATSFGPSRRDGPAKEAAFAYASECSCMRYLGSMFPVE